MSAWSDIANFLGGNTLSRDANQWSGDVLHAIVPGGGGTTSGTGPGQFSGPSIVGNSASPPTTSAQASANTTTQDLINQLSGLSYGQTQGGGAAGLATQLAKQLQSLPAADAEKYITALTKADPDSTLGTDIANDISPQPSSSSAQNYGFDPLDLGAIFSQTMAPWLAQQSTASNNAMAGTAAQMKQALGGASPAFQQAYGAVIPEMTGAAQLASGAANTQAVAGPEIDDLVSSLTNAVQQAKLTQAAAQNEPYVAAGAGTGTLPTSTSATSAQQVLNALTQKVTGTSS
jgi:hypothetical protein